MAHPLLGFLSRQKGGGEATCGKRQDGNTGFATPKVGGPARIQESKLAGSRTARLPVFSASGQGSMGTMLAAMSKSLRPSKPVILLLEMRKSLATGMVPGLAT